MSHDVDTQDGDFSALPHHEPRMSDVDPRAARRAERQVAGLFIAAMVTAIVFIVAFAAVPVDKYVWIPLIGDTQLSNLLLGLCLGLGFCFIGAGAIHWAKKLMPEQEIVGERHGTAAPEDAREETYAEFARGVNESGVRRRPLILATLVGGLAMVSVAPLVMIADLGPKPGNKLRYTMWTKGTRIVVAETGTPLKPSDLMVGTLVSAVPEGIDKIMEEEGTLNELAKAPVILVRMDPSDIKAQQGANWDYQGILCFSKICTHVGCPISLYEQQTHHLLCPCHQSTFDLADGGNVIFGPAARELPQLAITVDTDGYLVAQGDFAQPVGPSFWERG
jgi:ubiquinol-cytochrome c reductase iron-sulfur subunit